MISPLADPTLFHVGPAPITSAVAVTWGLMAFLLGGAILVTRRLSLDPSPTQSALELIVDDLLGSGDVATEVVLAGDIFYERDTAARAWAFLARQHDRGATVLIGDPGRSYLPRERLRAVADFSVPVTRDLEDADIKHTTVWALV